MDSSISDNPFEPDAEVGVARFPDYRYERVGASEDQLAHLRVAWDGMTVEEQRDEDRRLRGMPDDSIREELPEVSGPPAQPESPQVPTGPSDGGVVADPATQNVAGPGEATGGADNGDEAPPVPTTESEGGVVTDPTAQPVDTPVPDGSMDDVMGWVGDDADRARRALDAENNSEKPRKTLVQKLTAHLHSLNGGE